MTSPLGSRFDQRRARRLVTACLLAASMAAACGKKGNPLPPLRPVPARIADLSAVRTRDRITLRFTVPAANLDGTTPAAIDRVDIYRVIVPPGALVPATPGAPARGAAAPAPGTATAAPASPTALFPIGTMVPLGPSVTLPLPPATSAAPSSTPPAQPPPAGRGSGRGVGRGAAAGTAPAGPTAATVTADPKNILTRIAVRRTPPPSDATDEKSPKPVATPAKAVPVDTRPESGTEATFVDPIDASAVDGSTRYYVAVPVVGNGRGRPGPASPLIAVTLGDLPSAPADLALKFDETRVTATWTPAMGGTFAVLRTGQVFDPATAELLTPDPIAAGQFSLPVQFGKAVCLAVRTTRVAGPVRAEGPPSTPACVTPVDRFPPPAPSGLQAVQDGAAVTLIWTHVDAADLGGYVVLRGDGATGALQPLMRAAIQEVTYRDTTVQAGQTYTYAVYAVDSSPAANVSQLSDRQTVVIR